MGHGDEEGTVLTGKPPPGDGLTLRRRLFSEYNPDLTLDLYVSYTKLKQLLDQIVGESERKTKALVADPSKHLDAQNFREISAFLEADLELQALHLSFFETLHQDHVKIQKYLNEADALAAKEVMRLKSLTEDEVRAAGPETLVRVYHQLQSLVEYRELNAACFGKILRKYSDRCAYNSLLASRRVRYCDDRIQGSTVVCAPLQMGELLDWVASVYGIVFRATFEASVNVLKAARQRMFLAGRDRIVPMGKAYYYSRHAASRKAKQGSFARKVLAGSTSDHLTKFVCQLLSAEQLPAQLGQFANGEVSVTVNEAVRGDDIFVIQSLAGTKKASLSTIFMELCLILQTLRLASAKRAVAVLPYLGYTGSPTAEMSALAEMICLMGCDHVITVDMFNEQTEGYFSVPVENVSALYEFTHYILAQLHREDHNCEGIVVVAPDSHTVGRARAFADALMRMGKFTEAQFVTVATAVRRSSGPTAGGSLTAYPQDLSAVAPGCRDFIHEISITGDVKGKMCLIVDCVLDQGVNLHTIAELLRLMGAARIKAVVTHALFSGDAAERMIDAPIEELIVSDSINQDHRLANAALARKLRVLPLAPLIADAIERVHTENTLSTLFEIHR